MPAIITGAVEGITDEAVFRRLCEHIGSSAGNIYGRKGKQSLLQDLRGYNNSARYRHWCVLLDLDHDAECAPEALNNWLPTPSPLMQCRIAVREVEAWLLADAERIANYFSLSMHDIPPEPDAIESPKRVLVALANRSRRREIREDLAPRFGSGQQVGPAYASRIIEFVQNRNDGWRPDVAQTKSKSLEKCIAGLRALSLADYPDPTP